MRTILVNEGKLEVLDIQDHREYNKILKQWDKLSHIIYKTGSRGLESEETDPSILEAIRLRNFVMDSLMDFNYRHSDNDKGTDWRKIRLDRVGYMAGKI
jgi:hypothetical protein